MTKRAPVLSLTLVTAFAVVAAVGGGCGNRLLVGDEPDSGTPPAKTPATNGDASTPSDLGAPPTTNGADASAPLLPTTTAVVTPLPISANEALTRLATVLWYDKPDADLLSQAALGHIKTTGDLYVIREMLDDPRAAVGAWALSIDSG